MSQSNEFLLNNALAEDFQQMLRPYYLTQKLLCASKYSIKDNFVLPNSRVYYTFVVLVLCFITYTYFADSLTTPCTIANECPLITDVHNLLAHLILTVCVIVQTESAVKLLITLQGVDRKLKTFGVPKLPYFVERNWCSTIFVQLYFILGLQLHLIDVYYQFSDITSGDRMDEECKGASQKMTKNILRLCNVRFSKMRVCGLFIVDAALPLRLISLTATYCIVLLQFAFL
ncbi:hypothetical protein EVAR_61216_1 [Eumeta japonica]|uniref:Gustatory receptor n=1 Tax=Eumeta variegata TaxID=151549 RepID=A0A4C1Z8F7_EUMVA|nr:hypothetical protein EVAR_61216_1 [Eumeta japonica]